MFCILLLNRFKEPFQWFQWNCEGSYCKFSFSLMSFTLCTFLRALDWLLLCVSRHSWHRWCVVHYVTVFPSYTFSSGQDESGATAEERQNNQNAGLEGEESRPESRPLLQETQAGVTKASPALEDEDRGLGDSLPNTTSSSQTSLSALPTAASSGNTPRQSPTAFRLQPVDMVRGKKSITSQTSFVFNCDISVF